jgi:hypothetical protein
MQFDGFRERLLADDLFMAKVGMECFVGMFTKVGIVLPFSVICFLHHWKRQCI